MFEQFLPMFTGSPQGQQALSQLQGQGFTPQQAHGMIHAALPVAGQAMQAHLSGQGQGPGLLDIGSSNYCMNFLAGAVTGLVRGDGLKGAAIEGIEGVVGGHVAQVIAGRFGLPQRVAGVAGAVITPLVVSFLWEKYQGMQGQPQAPAAQPQQQGFLASLFGGGSQAPAQQQQTPYGVPVGAFGQPMFGQPQYGQPQYGQPQQQPFAAPPGFYGGYNR